MKTATTRGEHLWQVAATSFPRIAVAAGCQGCYTLVPAIIIPMPEWLQIINKGVTRRCKE
ncbi:hypothetical protein KKE26_03100 [bacterium]|nr:hypothetical protein [bacterium]